MRLYLLTSLLVWAFWVPASAQDDLGFVGVYADSLGLQPCATVQAGTSATLYVIAKLDGVTSTGITGAEFRIEVSRRGGWHFSYSPPPGTSVHIGNPLSGGVSLAFPTCQEPSELGQVRLGTIDVANVNGEPTNILVKRHTSPTNLNYACPLFTLCDAPQFSKVCMTKGVDCPLPDIVWSSLLTDDIEACVEQPIDNCPPDVSGLPQIAEENGRIGVFFDPAGQSCSTSMIEGSTATMYVIAILEGKTATGLSSAKFRIDGVPEGWASTPAVPAGATLVGDVLGAGATIEFPTCNEGLGNRVMLLTVELTANSTVDNVLVAVGRKEEQTGPSVWYPLFETCDTALGQIRALRGKALINPAPGRDCADYTPPMAGPRIEGVEPTKPIGRQ